MVDYTKLRLLNRKEYLNEKTLDKLLSLIDLANLPLPGKALLDNYRHGRRKKDSEGFTLDNASTVASKSSYDMSNFDLSLLAGDSKVDITLLTLDNDKIRAYLANHVYGSLEALEQVLIDLSPILSKLRSHFIHLKENEFAYTEPSYFQPIYTMFLEHVANRIQQPSFNDMGGQFPLSFDADVFINVKDEETASVTVTGKTDIVKVLQDNKKSEDEQNYDFIQFLLELKSPFASLFHCSSDLAKNQLICQLIGLWEMSKNRFLSMGALTDLFAIMLCFSYPENKKHYLMTKSVVDEESYLLHFLLLFCGDVDIRTLITNESDTTTENISRPNLDDGNHHKNGGFDYHHDREPDNGDGGGGASNSRGTALKLRNRTVGSSSTNNNGGRSALSNSTKKGYANTISTHEKREACCEDESQLQKWFSNHRGFVPLDKENLLNSQGLVYSSNDSL